MPTVHWQDIGGQESIKQSLKEAVEWPLLVRSLSLSLSLDMSRHVYFLPSILSDLHE